MENVSYHVDGQELTLVLDGRIDSSNAAQTESAIREICAKERAQRIVIDCDRLRYISSAGLRVVLRLLKASPGLKLINVRPEVYEIFDTTGFTEMVTIEKALRTISVEGCEVIGTGANGRVYRIDPETVVKTYLNQNALPEIERERELARTAFVAGIPTAIPYDVVRIEGGGYGAIYELVESSSFAKRIAAGLMSLDEAARRSVELLRIIHGTVVKPESVPDMRAVALSWADFLKDRLPEADAEKLCALIAAVPPDNHMLHGDFHVRNVMLLDGEPLLIDMDTICHGHPIFELGSMYNAYRGFAELDHEIVERFLGLSWEQAGTLWRKTLELYLDSTDAERLEDVERKARILGLARIMRRRIRRNGMEDDAGRREIDHCRTELAKLLPATDTLLF